MKNVIAEFRDVFSVYHKLGEGLQEIAKIDESKDPQSFINSVLQNRECLDQIALMNSQVELLSDSWKKSQGHCDPESRKKVKELVEKAKAEASRLEQLCGVQASKLQNARDRLGRKLMEMGNGSRYLRSLKPAKSNYPKFIDSLY